MNKTEINAKLQYVFEGLLLSQNQKKLLSDVVIAIIDAAQAGIESPEIVAATDDTFGGFKTGYTESEKNYAVKVGEDGKAYVTVPWTDNNTTYSAANSSTLGLVKQAATVTALSDSDEITTVISTVNTLISNLKTAGVVANS